MIRVQVEAGVARTKQVMLPVDGGPVPMGMHGEVAEHYAVTAGEYEPHATTLDYLVGAAVACLTGTFGGMLGALRQPIQHGELVADGEGDLVDDGGTLRVTAIRVRYRLRLAPHVDEVKVRRALERHAAKCPIARSISGCIDISTELTVE